MRKLTRVDAMAALKLFDIADALDRTHKACLAGLGRPDFEFKMGVRSLFLGGAEDNQAVSLDLDTGARIIESARKIIAERIEELNLETSEKAA